MDDYDLALTGGGWQPGKHGIQHWVPATATTKRTYAPPPPLKPKRVNVGTLIACPTCHATVSQTCRTRSGHTTSPHSSRLTPRLCECGATLEAKGRYCDPCRNEATLTSKREHSQRRRAAAREDVAA